MSLNLIQNQMYVKGTDDVYHTINVVAEQGAEETQSLIESYRDEALAELDTKWSEIVNDELTTSNEAAAMIADTFDSSEEYDVNDYVRYGTDEPALYRITAAHEADTSWAATSKVETTVGEELTELKSDLSNLSKITAYWYPLMEVGGLNSNTGVEINNQARFRTTDYIKYSSGQIIIPTNNYHFSIFYYDSNKTYLGWSNYWYSKSVLVKSIINNITVDYFKILGYNTNISDFTNINNHYFGIQEQDSLLNTTNSYYYLHDEIDSLHSGEYVSFGSATVDGDTATLTAGGGGLRTEVFTPEADTVTVRATLTFDTPTIRAQISYVDSDSTRHYVAITDDITSGEEFEFSFDAAYYAVYEDSQGDYFVCFMAPSGSSETYTDTTITIDDLVIYNPDSFRSSAYYDKSFPDMMEKTFTGLDEAYTAAFDKSLNLTAPNGSKYSIGINASGSIVAIPHIPDKTLFVGNSILLGMNTTASNQYYAYGMCATGPTADYYYKVKTAILAQNASATFDRLLGAPFEKLGTSDSFSTLWSTTINTFTGNPMCDSFTSDLDLIIIQLGDNINTDDRIEAFENNFDTFIGNIRTASPNARIIWVDGWFNHSKNHSIILQHCAKWNIENVDIYSLKTSANMGTSGQSYTTSTGGTATVSDTWITHPGNAGMTAIAEAIIDAIDM